MTELFNRPLLRFERRRYYYTVKDHEGAVVAKVAPIVGGPGPSRLARFFRAGPYLHRVVLQVTNPMGAPLLLVERPGTLFVETHEITVRHPDGAAIGRFFEKGIRREESEYNTYAARRQMIVDAQEQVVGSAVWESAPPGISAYRFNAKYCEYFNPEGEKLGRYEDYGLKLDYQLPEPLRTLIIASPLAFDIMDPFP